MLSSCCDGERLEWLGYRGGVGLAGGFEGVGASCPGHVLIPGDDFRLAADPLAQPGGVRALDSGNSARRGWLRHRGLC
ncbi:MULTISPECIES: hypothetical protein [Rhodococcus]|uniref:Uncharacterized protein n=1 Tax=Rhodococcus aetherivorans TaxID=191292 RepID=A0AA46PEU8_9NOCA|nr:MULTISPECIES: hypothetical protein [Rhodococcus]MBC2591799.1 hypothetical protein [Rhodococcus aetherivorans]QIX48965.1 hypothetical protein HFP48_04935 [Rhodococcus sp. DMU1]QRI75985.1 hypothetical protein JQ505_26500 [Rhodococcus aetherivorans]QSE59396.1 hypothetical protein JYA75_27600 [Rhodococcus sp. PSBB066]QSE69279.1 hypothetical protein JYA91_00020 [Rhodococcus sp. PSBB049]